MRIRLRPGLHYAPVAEGIYVGTPRTHFVIRGPATLHQLFDQLIPLLEDGVTEDEAAGIASPRLVRQVIAALRQRNLVLDLSSLSEPEPDQHARRRHAAALAELESDSDDPYAAFNRVRAARVLLAGPVTAVLPAARGLLRAGVGRLLLAVPTPADARALADRSAGVAVTELTDGKIAAEVGRVDAAMYVCDDIGLLDLQRAELDAGCPTVPVLTGGPLIVVGPPVSHPADAAIWPELCARAHRWQAGDNTEPVAMPVGEALAGALAGRSIFRTLAGLRPDSEAHIIYGGTLTADAVRIAPARTDEPMWYDLGDIDADEAPQPGSILDAVHAAAVRWLGRFVISTPDDLPQLPVAQICAEHREGPSGEVLAWGPEQGTATCAAGLACLRRQATATPSAEEIPAQEMAAVGAAGTTRARWLLDGALRLLADRSGAESEAGFRDIDELRSMRIWRAIEDYELVPITLRVCAYDGVSWRLGTVIRGDTGQAVARAWGPDAPAAIWAALSAAVSRLQTARTLNRDSHSRDLGGAEPDTTALIPASDDEVSILLGEVAAFADRNGFRIRGSAAGEDPLLGAIGLWHGTVRLEVPDARS